MEMIPLPHKTNSHKIELHVPQNVEIRNVFLVG